MSKINTISYPVKENKIFLANKKRGFGADYLNGYGGKKKDNESVENTAVREIKEEAGVIVSTEKLEKVAVIYFFEENELIFECHLFFFSEWEGELSETEEMAKPELYNMDNLPFDKMWDADKTFLPIICSGKKIKAKSYYKKGMDVQTKFEYELLG